jgi:hypothetical protein
MRQECSSEATFFIAERSMQFADNAQILGGNAA